MKLQINCLGGCPCETYQCDQTTTSAISTTVAPLNTAILVLSTYDDTNIPLVIDFNGNISKFNLKYEN